MWGWCYRPSRQWRSDCGFQIAHSRLFRYGWKPSSIHTRVCDCGIDGVCAGSRLDCQSACGLCKLRDILMYNWWVHTLDKYNVIQSRTLRQYIGKYRVWQFLRNTTRQTHYLPRYNWKDSYLTASRHLLINPITSKHNSRAAQRKSANSTCHKQRRLRKW